MNYEQFTFDKPALLNNGCTVNLQIALNFWRKIETMQLHPAERSLLSELREHALTGSLFHGESFGIMQALGFSDESGELKVEAKAVVLSAMHGDNESLQIVSPFADWSDRVIAQFAASVEAIKNGMQPDIAESVFKCVIGESWIHRIQQTKQIQSVVSSK